MDQTPEQRDRAMTDAGVIPPAPPAAPAPVPSPIQRTVYDSASQAESFLNDKAFTAPKSVDQIAEDKRLAARDLIATTEQNYQDKVREKVQARDTAVNQQNALSVLNGLMGSSEAVGAASRAAAPIDKEIASARAERSNALATIYSKIKEDAATEAKTQMQDATTNATDVIARRGAARTQAKENIKLLAAGGTDYDVFKNSPQNADIYKYALDAVGGSDEALRAYFMLNRPKNTIIGVPTRMGNNYVQAYENPITGKVSYEKLDLPVDLPTEYKNFQKMGDNLVAIPDNWDGDVTKLKTIIGQASTEDKLRQDLLRKQITGTGLENDKKQRELNGDGSSETQLYAGLSNSTATAVRARVNAFKSEPAITNFVTIQEGRNFAKSIATDTKNPADDQALIYALAKTLDPGSVVREGEYATAQKYAQSWISSYGKGVEQALAGTGFLSQAARENIKKTIETKYAASEASYKKTYSQYESGIGTLTGRKDGAKFLTDYTVQTGEQSSQNDQYAEPRKQLQAGEVLISRNGQIGAVPEAEFDPKTDTKL